MNQGTFFSSTLNFKLLSFFYCIKTDPWHAFHMKTARIFVVLFYDDESNVLQTSFEVGEWVGKGIVVVEVHYYEIV